MEVLLTFDSLLKTDATEKAVFLLMNKDKLSVARKLKGKPVIGDFVVVKGENISLLNILTQEGLLRAVREKLQTYLQGDDFYIAFPVYDYANRQIGALVTIVDFSRFNQIFQTGLWKSCAVILGVIFIAVMSFAFLFYKLLFNPLDRLSIYAEQVAAGELGAKIHGTFKGELLQLKNALFSMVENLKQRL